MAKTKKAPALEQNVIEILGFLDEGRPLSAPPEAEKSGMLRKLGDVGVAAGQGVVSGVKMLTDLAGAGNPVSGALESANKGLGDLYSPARMAERAARAQTIKDAEASGSTWEEIKAHAGGILEAPVQSIANAAGSMAPTVASAFIPGVLPARIAAGTMGIAQGVGTVKGSIYDAVERKWLEAGAPPEIAKQKADEAQAYGGENTPAMIAGGALGLVAGRSGVEHFITSGASRVGLGGAGVLARGARGAIAEAIPEGAQGGQERLAANMAEQNQGFDTPTLRGVVGSGVSEAMAAGPIGGGVAMLRPAPEAAPSGPLTRAAETALGAQAGQNAAAAAAGVDPAVRLAELEQKATGTKDQKVPGPDGKPITVPGTPAQFLTEAEKAERDSLKGSVPEASVGAADLASKRSAAQMAVRSALDAGVYGADAGPMPAAGETGPVQGPSQLQAVAQPPDRLAPLPGATPNAAVQASTPASTPAEMASDPLPAMHQEAADNLAAQKQFGGDRPGVPSTNAVVYQNPQPRDMPPAFEQPVTPGQIFESIEEVRARQQQDGEMLSGLVRPKNEIVPFRGKPPAIDEKTIDGDGLYRVIGEATAAAPDFADHTDLAGRAFAKNPRLTLEVLRDPRIDHEQETVVLRAITRGGNATAQYAKLALEAFQAKPAAAGAQPQTGGSTGVVPQGQEVGAAQPEPVARQEGAPSSTQGTKNGFIATPDGRRVRIAQHERGSNVLDPQGDAGAFTYEVSANGGDTNPLLMVLGKDGRLTPAKNAIGPDNKSNGTAWVPPNQEAADRVRALLEARSQMPVGSPERKANDADIKRAVLGEPAQVESDSTRPLTIEPVSDTTMVIRGPGKHKDAIKAAGGSWNGPQKGWIFPKARETQVRAALGDLVGKPAQETSNATGKAPEVAAPGVRAAGDQPAGDARVQQSVVDGQPGRVDDAAGAPAQRSGEDSPVRSPAGGPAAAVAKKRAKDPFLAFIGDQGGISSRHQREVTGEVGKKGNRLIQYAGPMFRKNGKPLDELARLAVEAGFLTQADIDSDLDNGGVNKITEMLRRAHAGEGVKTASQQEQEFEQRMAEFDEYNSEDLDLTAPDYDDAMDGASDLEQQRIESLTGRLVELLGDGAEAEIDRIIRVTDGLSQQEYADELARAVETASRVQGTEQGTGDQGGQGRQETDPGAQAQFGLEAPTAEGLKDRAAKDQARDKEKARRDAAPAPEDFTLTGSDSNADRAIAAGQMELGAAPADPAPAPKKGPAVSKNVIVTDDEANAIRARMKARLNRLNSNVDPEMLLDGMRLGIYHIERGARTFAAYAKAMIEDVGEGIRPYLKSFYMGIKYNPQAAAFAGDMDGEAEIDKAAPADGKPTLDTPEGRNAIAQKVADHFIGGNAFGTIVEARKFIAEITGAKIEAATQAAKLADETVEVAVVLAGREMVAGARKQGRSDAVIYDRLVSLYNAQPNLGVRSSTSVREQAYSTPVPLAFLASRLAGIGPTDKVLEPTAGNGMLLLEVAPGNAVANELNADRTANLRAMGFAPTSKNAATETLTTGKVDATVMNPPFGAVKDANGNTVRYDVAPGYNTGEVDHAIVFNALDAMKDDGKAVLIVGGVDASSEEQIRDGYRGKAKREFYARLYGQYQVTDHFTVDGDLYSRQGAGYPVDVIVIDGRGKSERMLPAADLPQRLDSWDKIKEKLNATNSAANSVVPAEPGARTGGRDGAPRPGDGAAVVDGAGRPGERPGDQGGQPGTGDAAGRAGAGSAAPGRTQPGGGSAGATQPGTANGNDAGGNGRVGPVPGAGDAGQQPGAGGNAGDGLGDVVGVGRVDGERLQSGLTDRRGQEQETATQVAYKPQSGASSVGTLVPVNMRDAIQASLERVNNEVGDVDKYVADALGFKPSEIGDYFSAEQVDALALAVYNAEKDRGFIIGDQTGIGKGRVVAGMIRYALNKGKVPIFVTEKPNLYADMIRDMDDIGMAEPLALESGKPAILITNGGESIPYQLLRKTDGEIVESNFTLKAPKSGKALDELLSGMVQAGSLGPYKVVFTTYNQLQTVKGRATERMHFVRQFGDGGYMIFDESHNAGGTVLTQPRTKAEKAAAKAGETTIGRAGFVRSLVQKSAGSFFSSATYAKRPDVMDLYSSTNMLLAVNKPADLGPAIKEGGVPMQQIVATMLTEDGQYIRRERTFAGVGYETREMVVDKRTAENMAESMRRVLALSRAKEGAVKRMQKELDKTGSVMVGGTLEKTQVQSSNFGSIMHNLIDQMLLALKVKDSLAFAIERLKADEKVVLTVSNTMGSFLKDYAEEMGLRSGEPVALSFKDLYLRYLEKQRIVKIKPPSGPPKEHRLTDAELGDQLTAAFAATREFIENAGFGEAPISPIDFMHAELRKAGFKTDEITGRTVTLSYGEDGTPSLASRQATIRQRLAAIRGFNSGAIDVLILNQSGSTGLSLHASNKVKDQRKRRMIIVQAEKNIDTHMQMLGRVHRTGQVVTPDYTQAMADIPAEMRPAAVLAKKMASLSANTTASRKSAVSAEGVVDFVNDYGGQVAVEYLMDNPEVHQLLGGSKVLPLPDDPTAATEDEIRKLTGYIPVLPIEAQEAIYKDLVDRYNELIERENNMGTNKLEARALDLDAKTLSSEQATPVKAGADTGSRFAAPAVMEKVDVKRTVKPMSSEEVSAIVAEGLDGKTPKAYSEGLWNDVRLKTAAYLSERKRVLTEAGADAMRVQREEDTIRFQLGTVRAALESYPVGTPVVMTADSGVITHAVLTGIVNTKKTKNPAAWSSWKVSFALADGEARTLTLNVGQLGGAVTLRAESGTVMTINEDGTPAFVKIMDLFDRGGTTRREKRWMVTGNILAGFAAYPGQIVSYTKDDGTTAQGVLMRRGFDFDKRKESADVAFQTPDQVREFLSKTARSGRVGTPDSALRIIDTGTGSFDVVTSSSKREGGTYFLDSGLTDAMGGDFYKAGGIMRARIGREELDATLEYLMNSRDDITLTALSHRDVARKVLGMGAPTADSAPKFSRGTDRPAKDRDGPLRAAKDRVSAQVDRIKATWPNAPEIIVIDSMADAPADVQANDAAQRSGGAKGDPEGFWSAGKVYLVASALETDADVERVLAHEVLGHAGLRGAFGVKVLGDILEQLAAARPAAIRAKLDEYGLKNTPAMRMVAAEEVLAELAQTQPTLGFVRRAIAAIRTWLRQRGVGLRMSDDEVVRNYILPARRFVQGQRTGESAAGSPVPAFSREDDVFVNEVLAELSQHDDLFRYSESKKTTLDGVMAEVFSQAKYLGDDTRPDEREESGADVRHVFQTALGKNFYIYERGKEVWADISRLEEGEHGGGIYAAILNYTHNAKKVLIGDPAGLSEAAVIRRTSAMLSSALRFGTTAHMDAAAEQRAGDPAKGIAPLKWQGDDVQKTSALIETFLSTLYTQMPALKGYRYDFRTRKFLDRSGRPLGPDRFADASRLGISRSARVGEATARRGIFLQSLVSSEGSARPGLLEQVLRRGNSLAGGDLRGMFSRKKTVEQARETFADMMQSTKAFNWWNKSIGTQYQKAQQNTTFRAVYNRVQDYIQDISDFGSRAAEQAPTLLPRLDKIRDVLKKPVPAADQKAIAAALYGGTLAGESVTDGRLWSDDELRTQFKLTDPQIALYREARAAIDQSIDDLGRTEIVKLVGDSVDPMFGQQAREAKTMDDAAEILESGLDEKIDEARQVDSEDAQRKVAHLRSLRRAVRAQTKRVNELKDAGYMPLMRFGKYAVNVPDPDVEGESLHFALFDSERLANAHARELRNDPQFAGKQITQGIISDRAAQLMQGVDPATLEIFAEAIGASESEVFQEYLKLVTGQRSAMKRLIERKGTPGYSEDIKRTLASFITSNARAASGNMHLRDLLLNTSKIKEGDVKDEAIGLVKHVLDPQPDPSAKARSLLFMQFIGGSVASALVNLTQPVTMTLPYLSQYSSPGHAANLLRKATMAAVRGVTGAEAEALKRAERDGIVSPQEIHFLYGEAEKAFGSNPLLQRAGFLWGAPFGLAEQFNRRATFIAAYRLGVERNEANPFAFAEKAVIETQGVYNRGNASNWARNPVGGALLTFKQFSVAYLELLKRLPNRERAIALAILALASGMEGLPGADDLDDILDTFAQAFGYNWSSKQAKREFITATLGPEMAQFTTRGVSAFLPMDISARMGLGNLLPGTGLLMQSRQDKGREVAEVFGAPGGAVQMVGKAATQAMAGEPIGAVSAVLPVALQNLLDPNRGALAMATAGQYKDDRGRRVVDVGALDALMKAAGFNPVNVAEPQMAMRIAKQSIDLARAVESEIAGDLAAARVESDSTRAASARARLADWNAKNPDTPIRIEESQIRRRAREMQTTKADRLTRTAPREMRAGIRRQVEAVDE